MPALLLPFLSAGAASLTPTLSVSGAVAPAATITVSGSGFTSRDWVDLRWDGAPTGASARVNSRNEFTSDLTVPGGTPAGTHQISAFAASKERGALTVSPAALAVISVTVGNSDPTPPPSIAPTPAPTASPTPTPVPVPTPTPAPTATPSSIIPGPSILSVTATSLTTSSATVIWVLTVGATGQVEYGRTAAFGSLSTPELSYTWSTHVQTLTGLTPGSLYYYRVKSRTTAGTWLISPTYTFTTLGSIISPTPTPTPTPSATPTPTPSATPTPTPAPTPPPASGDIFGNAIAADTLANTTVGPSGNRVGIRFRAVESGKLTSVRWFRQGGSGYAAGNGGDIKVSLQADNSGKPSGTDLASVTHFAVGSGSAISHTSTFGTAPTVTAGQLYHVVFTNVSGSASSNYTSVNALMTWQATSPRTPKYADNEWGLELSSGGGSWNDRGGYIPVAQFDYASGRKAGVGYMEVWVGDPKTISGSAKVRQAFTVNSGSMSISTATVRVKRTAGSGALTIRLESSSGTLIEERSVSTSSSAMGWLTVSFATARTLTDGQSYNLVLSAPSGTTYTTWAIRQGSSYGFATPTYDADGRMQYTSGSTWINTESWGSSSVEGDLQFYLR